MVPNGRTEVPTPLGHSSPNQRSMQQHIVVSIPCGSSLGPSALRGHRRAKTEQTREQAEFSREIEPMGDRETETDRAR